MNIEEYIRYNMLKKIFKTIFFDRRRGVESKRNAEESLKSSEMEVIEISEMLLKIKKSITPHISEEGSTLDEPTIQINKESDLEGETFW
ncbi:hypothetical protein CWI38_0613p0030 [Hamiltosporidium tvaerminnensis]|uniref:Uncharacterized protein n=2 Tax=Hamiltosporidium TaxID=1176354 RepID=A0A4V2JW81_9MICR|nr:hypothetical protein CWI36_0354p0020 [Hamiltosporidium magnivora]TBU12825.1 hypothetical protein CWI38_0613p0030 [Hamiltosporidium tvaerminnensis]